MKRIFNYLKLQDLVKLPAQQERDKGKITLFIEMENLLYMSFIPDENLGYLQNSATAEPTSRLFMPEEKLTIWYYERKGLREFMDFVNEKFEPILFTKSVPYYANFVVNQFDPENKYF